LLTSDAIGGYELQCVNQPQRGLNYNNFIFEAILTSIKIQNHKEWLSRQR